MQIVRTIFWILILAALLAFSFFNWTPVSIVIWENILLDTVIPALVVVSFLLGLVPTWLYSRGVRWSLKRRIASLETAARTNTAPAFSPAPPRAASAPEAEPAPVARPASDPAAEPATPDHPARTVPAREELPADQSADLTGDRTR